MKTQVNADSPDPVENGQPHGWDPYQVWLTRVQQPREEVAGRKARSVPLDSAQVTDLSETARLRALSALPSR